jgi:phosphate-selective porin OprO/OprP
LADEVVSEPPVEGSVVDLIEQPPEAPAGRPTIHFGGRFDFDNAWYSYDDNLAFGSSSDTRLDDGSSIRRIFLRAFGDVTPWLWYLVELNFTNAAEFGRDDSPQQIQSLGLSNAYFRIRHPAYLGEWGELRIGHVREPFSIERMTSSNFQVLMERSPAYDALLNSRDFSNGVVYSNALLDQQVTFSVSFARVGSTISPFGFGVGDGQYGTGVRLTALPVYEDEGRRLLHLGVAYLRRSSNESTERLGSRALVRGGAGSSQAPDVIQTVDLFVQHGISLFGVEAAVVAGPLSVGGELVLGWANDLYGEFNDGVYASRLADGFFPGAYVEVGYFLTQGDYRRYDKRYAVWDRQHVQAPVMGQAMPGQPWSRGLGAWQLVARYSHLDLRSPEPVELRPDGAQPGIANDVTLGVVWHLTTYSRIMANYVYTRIDSASPTASGDLHGLGIRFHVDF